MKYLRIFYEKFGTPSPSPLPYPVNSVQFRRTVGIFKNQIFEMYYESAIFFWHHNESLWHNDFLYLFSFSTVASGIIFRLYFSSTTIEISNSKVSICN